MTEQGDLQTLLTAEPYWIARAMQEQGSRFFRALGEALDAADARNRQRIYETWPEECLDFYRRGRLLEERGDG